MGPFTFETLCAYDVVIFDNYTNANAQFVKYDNTNVLIHHASISESDSGKLLQYDMMQILQDPSWDLKMLLGKIAAKRKHLYRDYARNSLFQSMFCCQKAKSMLDEHSVNPDNDNNLINSNGEDSHDVSTTLSSSSYTSNNDAFTQLDIFTSSCWQKCAAFYLADAICALNYKRSSPFHMLETLRNLSADVINEHVSVVTETIGIERATPTLLTRMVVSTVGFAKHVKKIHNTVDCIVDSDVSLDTHDYTKLISEKYDFLVSNSLMTDCYFYLGCINRQNMSVVSNILHNHPELIHILKVALDAETDELILQKNADAIYASCNVLFELISDK